MNDKIIVGIDETTEIAGLLAEGVGQFYFGYLPQRFIDLYATQNSLNRRYRPSEQFTDLARAYETIETIHRQGGEVFLALNAFGSNQTMRDFSEELYALFGEQVDGIIVANITTATMLKSFGYDRIVISNLFGIYTIEAVGFLVEQFAPIKIILPRDIALHHIQAIVEHYPQVAFECFLFGDNCRFSESFCFSEHGFDSVGFGSLCSFAHSHKKLLKTTTPSYKQTLIQNTTLTDEEKRTALRPHPVDIESLLDAIALHRYEHNTPAITKELEILSMYDLEAFSHSKSLYAKALYVLENLGFERSDALATQLKAYGYRATDRYRTFHKLNASAIRQTIAFFQRYPNIVSYKIPSRGRDFYAYLREQTAEPYAYQESQYNL